MVPQREVQIIFQNQYFYFLRVSIKQTFLAFFMTWGNIFTAFYDMPLISF